MTSPMDPTATGRVLPLVHEWCVCWAVRGAVVAPSLAACLLRRFPLFSHAQQAFPPPCFASFPPPLLAACLCCHAAVKPRHRFFCDACIPASGWRGSASVFSALSSAWSGPGSGSAPHMPGFASNPWHVAVDDLHQSIRHCPPPCNGHNLKSLLVEHEVRFIALTEHFRVSLSLYPPPSQGSTFLGIHLSRASGLYPTVANWVFRPRATSGGLSAAAGIGGAGKKWLRRSGASAKLPMKPALGVLPYVGFTEAGLAHSPSVPAIFAFQSPALQPSRSACFTMLPFLPRSLSLKWQSPPAQRSGRRCEAGTRCRESGWARTALPPVQESQS